MKKMHGIIVLFILILTAEAARAEDKEAQAPNTALGRIVVTPSRTEKGLSDVAASMSVVTESDIKNSDAKIVPDAIKNLAGIYAYDATGVGAGGTVNLRGFYGGMSSYQLVLIDGVPQNKAKDKLVNWDLMPIDNIDRIEIMRGPASSLYGDNAMSGVINIITKKPSGKPHAGASFSYSTFTTQNYGAYLSDTLNSFGYYLGLNSLLTNGFREHGDYENIQVYGRSNYSINDTQNMRFNFNFSAKTQGAFPWSLSQAQIAQNRRQARPGTENDSVSENTFSLDLAHHWGFGRASDLETIFYYRFDGMGSFYTSGLLQNTTRQQLERENVYGLPVRLKTAFDIFGVNNSVVTGIDLEWDNFNYEEFSAPFQTRRGTPTASYYVTRNKVGPYLQDEIKIVEILKAVLGVRWDWVGFDFDDRKTPSNSQRKVMSKTTPSFGLVLSYQEGSELYGSFGQAFRTPTIGQMFTYGASANTNLLPEEAANYEVGVRHHFNERLNASVSVYWMKINNEIWYDNASRKYQNYGRTFHDGVELGADYKVAKPLKLFGNYTYSRAVNDTDELKNKFLVNAPINKGTVGMEVDTGFGLKACASSTWIGTAYIDSANLDTLGHYNTVDVKISYKYRWFEAYFSIKNMFNKKYNSSGYKSANINYFTPEPGRTLEFGVSGDF
jgi:iron complex outermembrane recepter protein